MTRPAPIEAIIPRRGLVLIEKNQFTGSSMAGIQFEGDNGFWWEAGPTRNVIIRNNSFVDTCGAVLRDNAGIVTAEQ